MTNMPDYHRRADGTFAPGSGGRPRGVPNKVRRQTLHAVQELGSEAVAKLRERLAQGDMSAVKLVLSYCLPANGRTVELDSGDPNAVIDAVVHGEISPQEAVQLAQAFKTAGDASELKELKRQVEELEMLISSMAKR